jgi:uncharacterized membrane protein YiaA
MVADRRCLSVFLAAFPWVLVVLGTALFFVGVYYAELTEADTANGAMIAVGVVLILAAFAVSCVTNLTPRRDTREIAPQVARNEQLLPRVDVTL